MLPVTTVYEQFLSSLGDSHLADLSDADLEMELRVWLVRAIARFKYPYVALDIIEQENADGDKEWFFVEEITQKEIEVILAYMRTFWMDYLLANEKRVDLYYEDANLKLPSQSAMLTQLNRAAENYAREAKKVQTDYYKTKDYAPTIGDIWNT